MLFLKFAFVTLWVALTIAASPYSLSSLQLVLGLYLYAESDFKGLTDFVVDSKYSLLQLHRKLVELPSISSNEFNVGHWLGRYLQAAGFTVEMQKLENPERYNVYAYLGTQRNTSVVVTSHIDTVPPYIPYLVHGTEIRGRGTCDAKGSVASQIIAVLDLVSHKELHEGQVSLLFVVGEETSGSGMREASLGLGVNWDIAIFGEPTENKLGVGHKGILMFDVEVSGRSSHSGYPELGISATEILIPLLYKLQQLDLPQSELLGPSTLNVGRIEAGVAANVVPAFAKAVVSVRVADDLEGIKQLVRSVLDNVDHVAPFLAFGTEPQFLDYDVPGFGTIVLAYTTDIPNLSLPLKKRYLYGPGSIHVAHGDNEFVDNRDLLDAIDGYKKLIRHALAL